MIGKVKIGGLTFTCDMIKLFDDNHYKTILASKQVLPFSLIKSVILPAVSLEDIKLLPEEAHLVTALKGFNISSDNLGVYNPKLEIYLSPFHHIRLRGTQISLKDDEIQDSLIESAFINLDGLVLTNIKFIRKFSVA